jgi:hypothetical protein
VRQGEPEEKMGVPFRVGKNMGLGSLKKEDKGISWNTKAESSHMSLYKQPPNVNIYIIKFIEYPALHPHDLHLSRIYLFKLRWRRRGPAGKQGWDQWGGQMS